MSSADAAHGLVGHRPVVDSAYSAQRAAAGGGGGGAFLDQPDRRRRAFWRGTEVLLNERGGVGFGHDYARDVADNTTNWFTETGLLQTPGARAVPPLVPAETMYSAQTNSMLDHISSGGSDDIDMSLITREQFWKWSLNGSSVADESFSQKFGEITGSVLTRGQKFHVDTEAPGGGGMIRNWQTTGDTKWFTHAFFPALYQVPGGTYIVPFCVIHSNFAPTVSRASSNGLLFDSPAWFETITDQPRAAKVRVDQTYLGSWHTKAAVMGAMQNANIANGTYISIFPFVNDRTYDHHAVTNPSNPSEDNAGVWLLSGPSLGAAVYAAICGMPPIMYTGYNKAILPDTYVAQTSAQKGYLNENYHQETKASLNEFFGSLGTQMGTVEVSRSIDYVDVVQGLTFKMYYALAMKWPMVIPAKDSLGEPVAKIFGEKSPQDSDNALYMRIGRTMFGVQQMLDGQPYVSMRTPLLVAATFGEACILAACAWVAINDERGQHLRQLMNIEESQIPAASINQWKMLSSYVPQMSDKRSTKQDKQRSDQKGKAEDRKRDIQTDAGRARLVEAMKIKWNEQTAKRQAKEAAASERRAASHQRQERFEKLPRAEQSPMELANMLLGGPKAAANMLGNKSRAGSARWNQNTAEQKKYITARLILANTNAQRSGSEKYVTALDNFKQDFPQDRVVLEDGVTNALKDMGPGAGSPEAAGDERNPGLSRGNPWWKPENILEQRLPKGQRKAAVVKMYPTNPSDYRLKPYEDGGGRIPDMRGGWVAGESIYPDETVQQKKKRAVRETKKMLQTVAAAARQITDEQQLPPNHPVAAAVAPLEAAAAEVANIDNNDAPITPENIDHNAVHEAAEVVDDVVPHVQVVVAAAPNVTPAVNNAVAAVQQAAQAIQLFKSEAGMFPGRAEWISPYGTEQQQRQASHILNNQRRLADPTLAVGARATLLKTLGTQTKTWQKFFPGVAVPNWDNRHEPTGRDPKMMSAGLFSEIGGLAGKLFGGKKGSKIGSAIGSVGDHLFGAHGQFQGRGQFRAGGVASKFAEDHPTAANISKVAGALVGAGALKELGSRAIGAVMDNMGSGPGLASYMPGAPGGSEHLSGIASAMWNHPYALPVAGTVAAGAATAVALKKALDSELGQKIAHTVFKHGAEKYAPPKNPGGRGRGRGGRGGRGGGGAGGVGLIAAGSFRTARVTPDQQEAIETIGDSLQQSSDATDGIALSELPDEPPSARALNELIQRHEAVTDFARDNDLLKHEQIAGLLSSIGDQLGELAAMAGSNTLVSAGRFKAAGSRRSRS